MMKADAVIVAAGKGHRFIEGRKKQYFSLGGKPVLAHTLHPFNACSLVRRILVVVGQEDLDYCLKEIVEKYGYNKVLKIVPGGEQRQESVKKGLDALPKNAQIVLIHDGVRPFVTQEMIEESVRSASRVGAVVIATPVKDTIKMTSPAGTVLRTLERESLWQAQTPQTFQASIIRKAYQKATEDGYVGTDDASLVERLGQEVHLLPGSYNNIKITTPEDLILANLLLKTKPPSKENVR